MLYIIITSAFDMLRYYFFFMSYYACILYVPIFISEIFSWILGMCIGGKSIAKTMVYMLPGWYQPRSKW